MATTTNKQRLLNQLFASVEADSSPREAEPLPVLDQFIYAICREGCSRDMADHAFRTLREQFFDWNEVRVSATRELEEVFEGMPFPERRAQRLVTFLQEVFETTFSFDLEMMQKKGVKEAAKKLSRFEAANPFVVSWVVQHSLGGHSIPMDAAMLRTARRLGLVDDDVDDPEVIQASLEHLIPKSKGAQFTEILSEVTQDYCWEDSPNCSSCPGASECPTGQTATPSPSSSGRTGRVKPR
jgi:endonuclease-3